MTPTGTFDEEDRSPAQPGGQHAADQDACRCPRAADRAPDAKRPGALRPGVGRRDDRQGSRGEQGRARPLAEPGRDQRPGDRRKAAGQRRRREDRQAGQEHPPSADDIGRAPAEQHQPAAGQHVGGDHPLQPASLEAQRPGDRGQRDVHHGGVEDDHELRHAQQDQQRPRLLVPRRARQRRSCLGSNGPVRAARAAGTAYSVHVLNLPRADPWLPAADRHG
jgi:hypothetical protein